MPARGTALARLIKGQQKLATIADETAQLVGIVGLPCIDAEQAETLYETAGEKPN
jgi:hypothetical protein